MKEWLKKTILLAATILFCILLLEAIFRIYWPYQSIYVSDDELSYKPKPNMNSIFKNPEGEVRFWTNSEGFVNQNPKKAKGNATRIFIVGDSFVEGLYTQREKHFTTILQNRLNSQNKSYEVISYGTSSWGTDNEYKYITMQATQYSPDIIILAYYQNDLQNVAVSRLFSVEEGKIIPKSIGGTRTGNKIKKLITKCSLYSSFCSYFQVHAGGFKILHPIMFRLGFSVGDGNSSIAKVDYKADPYTQSQESKQAIEEAWEKTELLLKEIKDVSAQNGARLHIAYIPPTWEVSRKHHAEFLQAYNLTENEVNMSAFRTRLWEISERNGIGFSDPTEAFIKSEGKELYLSFVHFTEEGDRLFAETLFRGLT